VEKKENGLACRTGLWDSIGIQRTREEKEEEEKRSPTGSDYHWGGRNGIFIHFHAKIEESRVGSWKDARLDRAQAWQHDRRGSELS